MNLNLRTLTAFFAPVLIASLTTFNYSLAAQPASSVQANYHVVFSMTVYSQHTWNEVFGNFHNIQRAMGPGNVTIEMVVYGDAIPMLSWDSPVANRVQDAIRDGVKIVACENSMDAHMLTYDDMQPNLDYVRAGIVELIKLQTEGWAYIRP